jgi:hypothetical protein
MHWPAELMPVLPKKKVCPTLWHKETGNPVTRPDPPPHRLQLTEQINRPLRFPTSLYSVEYPATQIIWTTCNRTAHFTVAKPCDVFPPWAGPPTHRVQGGRLFQLPPLESTFMISVHNFIAEIIFSLAQQTWSWECYQFLIVRSLQSIGDWNAKKL